MENQISQSVKDNFPPQEKKNQKKKLQIWPRSDKTNCHEIKLNDEMAKSDETWLKITTAILAQTKKQG